MRERRARVVVPLVVLAVAVAVAGALALRSDESSNAGSSAPVGLSVESSEPPEIELFGGTTLLVGGGPTAGFPQAVVNIPGHVSDDHGVEWAGFRVNGGAKVALTLGPASPRLARRNDFNAEILLDELREGENVVTFTAGDGEQVASRDVIVVAALGSPAGGPETSIAWAGVEAVDAVAHVVDGRWALPEGGGVRTAEPGFERAIALGDVSWTDYSVRTSVTVHALNEAGFLCNPPEAPSCGPKVGLALRWRGYEPDGNQPSRDRSNLGAEGVYAWKRHTNPAFEGLELSGSDGEEVDVDEQKTMAFGVTYQLEMTVTTLPDASVLYTFKFWNAGSPDDAEPQGAGDAGLVTGVLPASSVPSGSVLLVAHEADVTFGDVVVRPLS